MDNDICFIENGNWFRYKATAIIIEEGCVLFATNETCTYFYPVGGGVHYNETSEDAVKREVFEETGIHYEIDHLAFIHENFFHGSENLKGLECHEIAFYYLMKSKGNKKLDCHSFTNGVEERMKWVKIEDLDKVRAYPTFFKDELTHLKNEIKHIVTDERKAN